MRDFWMPFAPTMLASAAPEYIKNWDQFSGRVSESMYYMITAVDSTSLAQKHLAAAIHQKDKTLRPQLVDDVSHPWMFATLTEYKNLTGMSGMMNTSLNIHGNIPKMIRGNGYFSVFKLVSMGNNVGANPNTLFVDHLLKLRFCPQQNADNRSNNSNGDE